MEYKFRAVDLSGNYITDIGSIEFFVDGQIIVNGEIPVRHLLQYTGLKDKNGVEAYVSDMFKDSNGALHLFCADSFGIWDERLPDRVEWNRDYTPELWSKECEIIGNIYTNTELLNAK